MNKTKIDWCDSTWNPVTGCRNTCKYCYARRIATRFGGKALDIPHTLNEPFVRQGKAQPYPFGFIPTFHRYRLNDYIDKKGRNIFVCSMADLFGEWVPDEWIKEVFEACDKAPQHNYLFLTKNPNGIPKLPYVCNAIFNRHDENLWFGTTITSQKDLEDRLWTLLQVKGHVFLSVEPLLGELNLGQIRVTEKKGNVLLSLPNKMAYYFGGGESYHMPEWVIVGAETGRRKNKVIPKREWIEKIVWACREAEIPVFMKSSLAEIWGEPLIQEFPKALKQE